jgi:hypothetical protein
MQDKHVKFADTFATYAVMRLPVGWREPARLYTWRVDPMTARGVGGDLV